MPLRKIWIALLFVLALIGFAHYFNAFKSLDVWWNATRKIEDWPGAKTSREAPGFYSLIGGPFEQRLHWIDNDTLLFPGNDEPARPDQNAKLRTWNWRTNAISDIDLLDKRHVSDFCYADGFVRYVSPGTTPDEVILKSGPLHHVTQQTLRRDDPVFSIDRRSRSVEQLNPFTCQWYLPSDLGPEGLCIYPLRQGDGYVDFSGRNCRPEIQARRRVVNELPSDRIWQERKQLDDELRRVRAVWYATPHDAPVEMTIDSGELPFNAHGLRYSAWSQEYVIEAWEPHQSKRESGNWPKGVPHPIYLFSRGGRVTTQDMPYLEMNEGQIVTVLSSRPGLIIVNARSFPGTLEGRGVYLLQSSKLFRVIPGDIQGIAVSPDGCGLAAIVRLGSVELGMKVREVQLCS